METRGSANVRGGDRAKNPDLVLVTGSSGLLGSKICRALKDSYRVVGLDVKEPQDGALDDWLECDLTDDGSVARVLCQVAERFGSRIASVVHLAAYYDFSGEPSPLYDELTVEGTRRLLKGLRDGEFEVGQFLFSSSLLVLRSAGGRDAVLDEDSPLEAEWEYPRSKLEAEAAIREERGDVPALVLRIAGVYDEDCHSIPLAQQMRRIYERKLESYVFPGDPDRGQPFVHVDDVVRCVTLAVEKRRDLEGYEVLLVGEPEVVTYGELQDLLGEAIHGHAWPTIRIPAPVAKAGAWIKEKTPGADSFIKPWMVDLADAHMPISARRARERLGWQAERRLRSTLPEMARRLVEDPARWYAENGLEPPKDAETDAHTHAGSKGLGGRAS